ncbi:hypothetical protein T10_9672 [Trichinella papuae]|uniref:Uncharacterized protein n=1 Tax=Trichinella papuae TaxID=268474 RepID=A0A0V1MVX6_9BILA|nr:hypothetical protein T10_9672 [Trichinella papuae]
MTKREYFSLCLDESTDQADEGFTINEELPSLISLRGTTKGTFKTVLRYVVLVTNYRGFDKCSCIVRDGAKAMTGIGISFCMLWKHNNINCPTVQQELLRGKIDAAYDMTNHLNELNLKLLGKHQNIATLYDHLNGFKKRFEEMKNLEGTSFSAHVKYVETVIEDFENRFIDFKEIEDALNIQDRFFAGIEKIPEIEEFWTQDVLYAEKHISLRKHIFNVKIH